MIPDLGKYAVAVIGAYAATILVLAGIVALTWWRGAKVKRALREVEARHRTDLGKDNG